MNTRIHDDERKPNTKIHDDDEKANTMIHDDERRPTRGFMTSSRRDDKHKESRRGDRANTNTKYQENVRITPRGESPQE